VNNPGWVQYYGYTESGSILYPTNNGQHTGVDWGRSPQDLGGSWNYDIGDWEFDGTYGTPEHPLIPVYAGCDCTLVLIPGEGYVPGRVDLVSNNPDHSDFLLIYGHLQDIPFARGKYVIRVILGHFVNPFSPLDEWLCGY
jgi:hypothetical protein